MYSHSIERIGFKVEYRVFRSGSMIARKVLSASDLPFLSYMKLVFSGDESEQAVKALFDHANKCVQKAIAEMTKNEVLLAKT